MQPVQQRRLARMVKFCILPDHLQTLLIKILLGSGRIAADQTVSAGCTAPVLLACSKIRFSRDKVHVFLY